MIINSRSSNISFQWARSPPVSVCYPVLLVEESFLNGLTSQQITM